MKKVKNIGMPVYSVCSMEDKIIVSGGGGGGIKNRMIVFEVGTDIRQVKSFDTGQDIVENLCWSSYTCILLCRFSLKDLQFQQRFRFKADFHTKDPTLNFTIWSPMGYLIATGGDDGVLRLFRYKGVQGKVWKQYKVSQKKGALMTANFSKRDPLILVSTQELLSLYNIIKGEAVAKLSFQRSVILHGAYFRQSQQVIDIILTQKSTSKSFVQTHLMEEGSIVKKIGQSNFLTSSNVCISQCDGSVIGLGTIQGQTVLFDREKRISFYYSKGHDEMIVKGISIAEQKQQIRMFSGAPSKIVELCRTSRVRPPRGSWWTAIVAIVIALVLYQLLGEPPLEINYY